MNKHAGAYRATVLAALTACVAMSASAQTTQQEHVHQMSHGVMPFDMSKTVHVFKMTEQGGVERVVTREVAASDQILSFNSTYSMKHSSFKKETIPTLRDCTEQICRGSRILKKELLKSGFLIHPCQMALRSHLRQRISIS